MTRPYIEKRGLISLDGKDYRLDGPVRSFLANNYAPKVVIGDVNQDAHEDASVLRWDDWTGGIGLEEFGPISNSGEIPKRAWFSTCDLSHVGHLTLGPLATETAQVSDQAQPGGNVGIPRLASFKNEIYCAFRTNPGTLRTRVFKYDNSTDSWGSSLHDLDTASGHSTISSVVGHIGGTEYLVYLTDGQYSFTSDGSSWTNSTKDVVHGAIWDDRLWGVDADGNFWYATTPGTETDRAPVPLEGRGSLLIPHVTSLFVGPTSRGEKALYCGTSDGLFIYDVGNDRWIKTGVVLPRARFNCRESTIWNADMYVPAGLGMYRVVIGATTQVLPMGLDRDHGVPTNRRGAVFTLANAFQVLVAGLFSRLVDFSNSISLFRGDLFAWDGKGWQVLHDFGENVEEGVKHVIATSAYETYRVWFSSLNIDAVPAEQKVYFIDMPSERVNPDTITTRDYAASATHETPWFKVGEDVTGIALTLTAETKNPTTSETVKVEYDTDYSGTYKDFVDANGSANNTITTAGATELVFRDDDDLPAGKSFRAIRFRVTLARGATTTNTPDLLSLTLKFLKKLDSKWHHSLALDISQETGGFSPREQWTNLRSTIDSNALVEFTFKDDATVGAEQRFWVKVDVPEGEEESGFEYGGKVGLLLKEP